MAEQSGPPADAHNFTIMRFGPDGPVYLNAAQSDRYDMQCRISNQRRELRRLNAAIVKANALQRLQALANREMRARLEADRG